MLTKNFFRLFRRRHVWKVGAVVTYCHNNTWYYLAFKSLTLTDRGIQIVRGHLEPGEGLEEGVLREVKEELQLDVELVAPLGLNYFETDRYSDCQIYYVCRLKEPIDPTKVWTVEDKDSPTDEVEILEWRSYPLWKPPTFLARGQADVIFSFRRWIRWNEDLLRK